MGVGALQPAPVTFLGTPLRMLHVYEFQRSCVQKFALVLFHMLFVAKVLCHRFFVAALALTARLSWPERF